MRDNIYNAHWKPAQLPFRCHYSMELDANGCRTRTSGMNRINVTRLSGYEVCSFLWKLALIGMKLLLKNYVSVTTGERCPFRLWSRGQACWQRPFCPQISSLNPTSAAPFSPFSLHAVYNSISLFSGPFFTFLLIPSQTSVLFFCPEFKQFKFPFLSLSWCHGCYPLATSFSEWYLVFWKLSVKIESAHHSSNLETWQVPPESHLC